MFPDVFEEQGQQVVAVGGIGVVPPVHFRGDAEGAPQKRLPVCGLALVFQIQG